MALERSARIRNFIETSRTTRKLAATYDNCEKLTKPSESLVFMVFVVCGTFESSWIHFSKAPGELLEALGASGSN